MKYLHAVLRTLRWRTNEAPEVTPELTLGEILAELVALNASEQPDYGRAIALNTQLRQIRRAGGFDEPTMLAAEAGIHQLVLGTPVPAA